MATDIACPACGESEDLRGERLDDLIVVACGACDHRWERNPAGSCDRCGGSDMRPVPKAVMQKVRGSQRSIIAVITVHLCGSCDQALIDAHLQSGAPIMPDEPPPPRG